MATQNTDRWLTCQLDRGMFSDEMVVTYPPTGEPLSSEFIPISYIHGNAGSLGKVRVAVAENQGRSFALLPTPYGTIVQVQPGDITDTP